MHISKRFQILLLIFLVVIFCYIISDNYIEKEKTIQRETLNAAAPVRIKLKDKDYLSRLAPPEGYSLGIFASGLNGARFMRVTEKGDLLLSIPSTGSVMLLERDSDEDGKSDGIKNLISNLNKPHGIDFYDKYLYVAEADAVGRVLFDHEKRLLSGSYERIINGLPTGGHWTRTIRFGPDGFMYLSIGSSCNVCIENDHRRAAIVRYKPDGSKEEVYASGLRNTVGFDWNPANGKIYGTDNGRDMLGDDFPPCELNLITKGGNYGWPFANGNNIPDPDFSKYGGEKASEFIKPVHNFRAHNAPLGIVFLKSSATVPEYRGSAIVALHGSWNRSRKDGYKVVSLKWDKNGGIAEKDFLTGFLRSSDDNVIGRPVDVVEDRNGVIYVSDDYAGNIYILKPEKRKSPIVSESNAERLWMLHECFICHVEEGKRDGKIKKQLSGLSSKFTKESLEAFLRTPPPPMPDNKMNDTELESMSEYLLYRYP